MHHILKAFMKSIAILVIAGIMIVGLAFMSAIKNPVPVYPQQFNTFDTYEEKRSEQNIIEMKRNCDTLAKTGSCVGCNFSARRDEGEKRDLYQSIQSAKNKGLTIDLSHANLFFTQLAGLDLSEANLSGADLMGAHLEGANLSGANLIGANLAGANLQGANLTGANLTASHLGTTQLKEANLTNAILHKAVLVATTLYEANLTNADLTDAIMYMGRTHNTKFIGTDFRGARINTVFAKNTDFTNAKLDNWIMRSFYKLTLWIVMMKSLVE
jgi:uncharacterized protein YjbI with pentapeptide repeats